MEAEAVLAEDEGATNENKERGSNHDNVEDSVLVGALLVIGVLLLLLLEWLLGCSLSLDEDKKEEEAPAEEELD